MHMSTERNPSQKRWLPWVLVAAVTLLFISTLATVGVVWWVRRSSAFETRATVAHDPKTPSAAANWSAATFSANAEAGVRQTSENSWSIKGGRAFMNVRRKD